MRRVSIVAALVVGASSVGLAQVFSQAEADAWLASRSSTTRPATLPSASGAPAHARQHWAATTDAPAAVQHFVAALPDYKAKFLDGLEHQIVELRRRKQQIAADPQPTLHSVGISSATAIYAAADAKMLSLQDVQGQINKLQERIDAIQADDLWLPDRANWIQLRPGAIGKVGYSFVIAIVDSNTFIARFSPGEDFCMSGVNATTLTVGSFFTYDSPCMITASKHFTPVAGVSETVPVIEPLNLEKYLVAVTPKEHPPKPSVGSK